jgi:hypothetical protein
MVEATSASTLHLLATAQQRVHSLGSAISFSRSHSWSDLLQSLNVYSLLQVARAIRRPLWASASRHGEPRLRYK